jgi:hypothetical protein
MAFMGLGINGEEADGVEDIPMVGAAAAGATGMTYFKAIRQSRSAMRMASSN